MRLEAESLARVRTLVLRGDLAGAENIASEALKEHPQSSELRRALAGIHRHTRRHDLAETLLREVLAQNPEDPAAAFTLAEILQEAGRMSAAAAVMRAHFAHGQHDADLAIRAIELLDDCRRLHDAAAIAEGAIAANPQDVRLHAYAGMVELQTGEFARAREHYLFALEHSTQACEWNAPHGLASAQRYSSAEHPDFRLFRDCLERTDLSDKARSTLLFALAKAHDDVGDYAQAAQYFRQANGLAHALTKWSRKNWRRAVESRLAGRPYAQRLGATDWTPVFIVGMPRSGTTLVAERLALHPQVCNRGELPWLANLAQRPALVGNPSRAVLEHTAAAYAAQLRQDDASDARWFIDKQPLNFRYVDLMLALWPQAKVVYCRRNARDTALSLWSQSFLEEVQGYSYDFADIAVVMRDCERLMTHWRRFHGASIRDVHYEQLVAEPELAIAGLAAWLELPSGPAGDKAPTSISTASLWQARQPVHTHSVERWRNYAAYVPELLRFPAAG
ncbi:MAG TPA: sulfotransferase [Rudaea sp.]|nr:sulfotransferase [Rudaea sp.]